MKKKILAILRYMDKGKHMSVSNTFISALLIYMKPQLT